MIQLENGKTKLYQWDLNQRLILNIEVGTQVHFASNRDNVDHALVVLSYIEEDVVYADIPNVMLQAAGIINVYIYPVDGDEGHTQHHFKIRVVEREKPANYIYTETETESGGIPTHDQLKNRDKPEQHPMSAITGLVDELQEKIEDVPTLSNMEIEAILNNFV
jgi:hypothetical protein